VGHLKSHQSTIVANTPTDHQTPHLNLIMWREGTPQFSFMQRAVEQSSSSLALRVLYLYRLPVARTKKLIRLDMMELTIIYRT
jgi:hypothetical protein